MWWTKNRIVKTSSILKNLRQNKKRNLSCNGNNGYYTKNEIALKSSTSEFEIIREVRLYNPIYFNFRCNNNKKVGLLIPVGINYSWVMVNDKIFDFGRRTRNNKRIFNST